MSSPNGRRNPQPLASTSTPVSKGKRTPTRVARSAELGEATRPPVRIKGTGGPVELGPTGSEAADDRESSGTCPPEEGYPHEWVENDLQSPLLGYSPPRTVRYELDIIDARNRGAIAKRLLNLMALILIGTLVALVVATFTRVPAEALITCAKWEITVVTPLFTMALGYYFGTARTDRREKR